MARHDLGNPNHIFIDDKRTDVLFEALGAGAARNLMNQTPFMISQVAMDIKVEIKGEVNIINKRKQRADFEELWGDPYLAPYTFCVSSSPSEVMAQMTAMRLFLRAIAHTRKYEIPGVPRWHTILGGWGDKLRDAPRDREINLLVLDNVVSESTATKVEKLRDIIKIYGDIPKIIVTAADSPTDFMSDTLKMGVHYAMWLGHKRKIATNV